MKGLKTHIALLATLLAGMAACNDSGDHLATARYRYDMVTYKGYADGRATFEYIGRGDSAAITLQASGLSKPQKIKEGQRVLLYYIVEATPSENLRTVKAKGYTYSNVASDTLRVNPLGKAVSDYKMHPVKLHSLWKTGNYLNMRAEVEYTTRQRMLYLLADRNSLDSDTVHCYLVHDLMEAGDTTYFWRTCYGSFYTGNALQRPNCRVLRIHVNDEINPKVNHYDFAK